MNKKSNIEKKVEKALEAYENMELIKTSPFFESKLRHRIQVLEEQAEDRKLTILVRRLQPALYLILILINLFTLIYILSPKTTTKSEMVEAIADEIYVEDYYSDIIE